MKEQSPCPAQITEEETVRELDFGNVGCGSLALDFLCRPARQLRAKCAALLFVAQRHHGIELRRTARWNVAGPERHSNQQT